MKRILFSLVAIMLVSLPASAQTERDDNKVVDTKFATVAGALVASTIFDMETSFPAIRNHGGQESNPVMKPFINSGRTATYVLLGGIDAGIIYTSYHLRKSERPSIRKLWWVMPVVMTAGHAVAGGLNLRFTIR